MVTQVQPFFFDIPCKIYPSGEQPGVNLEKGARCCHVEVTPQSSVHAVTCYAAGGTLLGAAAASWVDEFDT